jgi:carboxymethylenebutenolidase
MAVMCLDNKCHHGGADRRSFLSRSAAALVGLASLAAEGGAQEKKLKELRATDDPNISLETVEFKSGADTVDGYYARPKGEGPYTPVLVVPGNWVMEPYIPETAAMLAQAGYAGLVVNVLHYFPKVKSYEEADKVPWETTQALIRKEYSDERTVRNIRSGIDYVKSRPGVKAGGVGILGFCGGGWQALLSAAQGKDLAAVVAFYAPVALKLPGRKTPMDVVKEIKVPVQGHYGTKDKGIPSPDVKTFEEALRAQGTPVEIFTYEAGHGFFACNRDEAYQPEAAKLAWSRVVKFFKDRLK